MCQAGNSSTPLNGAKSQVKELSVQDQDKESGGGIKCSGSSDLRSQVEEFSVQDQEQ